MADVDAWMPLWIGDYLADTTDLTTEEHGAYFLLLMAAWRNEGRLPAAPERLARIAKLGGRDWAETWKSLERFFEREGDDLVQGRVARERAEAIAKRAAASEHGRKGARARHGTPSAGTRALPEHVPEHNSGMSGAKPEIKPSPSPSEGSPPDPIPSLPDPPSGRDQGVDRPRVPEAGSLTSASGILSAFGSRWERAERKPFFKAPFDDRTAHDLAESINDIPDPERRASAWAEIVPAIERYLRTSKPFYAGHPFAKFVKDLNELRVPEVAPAAAKPVRRVQYHSLLVPRP